ncbi:hypothetical protein Y1Q_0016354 [Alligator mississippiensis]|uniref:Uncharacterized protein n=1 Tax=Alligator mississippiensis TaxID=8496 RepID=A0A151N2K1_ALLMI|nr:hypothetical protein Y1Q_0016354 [Alligator mississippiensis]
MQLSGTLHRWLRLHSAVTVEKSCQKTSCRLTDLSPCWFDVLEGGSVELQCSPVFQSREISCLECNECHGRD